MTAIEAAGLKLKQDKGQTCLDQEYVGTFGQLELRAIHTWRDTSKTFSSGRDRTRVTLAIRHGEKLLDNYTIGYEK